MIKPTKKVPSLSLATITHWLIGIIGSSEMEKLQENIGLTYWLPLLTIIIHFKNLCDVRMICLAETHCIQEFINTHTHTKALNNLVPLQAVNTLQFHEINVSLISIFYDIIIYV